jgi:uncharacterized phosphosugar-binding protein
MADYASQFFAFALDALEKVRTESSDAIRQTAQAVADCVEQDKLVFLFGSGHSALVARDAVGRAGGLLPAILVEDLIEGDAERVEGVAAIIASRYDLSAGGVFILISNSGINPVPIEMAMIGREFGMKIIVITSLAHSQSVNSRHSSGKKLFDLADIVIDTHTVRGDAAIEVEGSEFRTGSTSTMIGCAIIQAITVEAVGLLAERGITPPILVSANIPEGKEHGRALMKRYGTRLVRHVLPLRADD